MAEDETPTTSPRGDDATEKKKQIFIGTEPGNTMKIALLGLPNSGKSSLYNALVVPPLENLQPTDDFIFTTLEKTKGSFAIPDKRLDWYEEIFGSLNVKGFRSIVCDGPALVKGSFFGEGEGMMFMDEYRDNADVFYFVLRGWNDPELTHYEETVDPARDAEILNQELMMADIYTIETRLVQLYTEHDQLHYDHQPIGKNAKWEKWTLIRAYHWLVGKDRVEYVLKGKERKHDPMPTRCNGWGIRHGEWNSMEIEVLHGLRLYTSKPVIYVLNVTLREHTRNRPEWFDRLQSVVRKIELGKGHICHMSVALELKMVAHQRNESLTHYCTVNPTHISQIGELNRITAASCNLITFYTGKTPLSTPGHMNFIPEPSMNELFAWRCRSGKIAQDAAKLIDTELGRYFNRMTMYSYDDLVDEKGDFDRLLEFNKNRMQQKKYIMVDGDCVEFFSFGLPKEEYEKPKKTKNAQ